MCIACRDMLSTWPTRQPRRLIACATETLGAGRLQVLKEVTLIVGVKRSDADLLCCKWFTSVMWYPTFGGWSMWKQSFGPGEMYPLQRNVHDLSCEQVGHSCFIL